LQDVEQGLGLLLFPEWYNIDAMNRMRFFDDNTRSWWTPVTGGSNIPAVNDLVAPFGLTFASTVLAGRISVGPYKLEYASGTSLLRLPRGARVLTASLLDQALLPPSPPAEGDRPKMHNILGLVQHAHGRIGVYGDANCLDANHATSNCHEMLLDMFQWATAGEEAPWMGELKEVQVERSSTSVDVPMRPDPDMLAAVSYVKLNPAVCHLNSAQGFQSTLRKVQLSLGEDSCILHWRRPSLPLCMPQDANHVGAAYQDVCARRLRRSCPLRHDWHHQLACR
jgi:hypothetical protein